ncbi:MAG: hypothetical protein CMH32_00750 [Micavibrio sp.]|nr:hypothetical protein [Micavibrio sp.]HCK33238.1 hypothetical protein [Rhodospirillaceae bacterium]|tara:strand:+ start:630 stop:1232 length:603 start_codon:yes stop_codon:yes gene_type:complete
MSDIASKPIKLHFVRHIRVDGNGYVYGPTVDFNKANRHDLQECADQLPSPDQSLWFSSDFPRAAHTAMELLILKQAMNRPTLRMMPSMREHSLKPFEGYRWEDLWADEELKPWFSDPWTVRPDYKGIEGGETLEAFEARIADGITKVIDAMTIDKNGKREAVIVCHGGVLQMARYLAGRTTRETYLEPYPEYLEVLTLEI